MSIGKLAVRKCDSQGCGNFGASRDGGKRKHVGIDLVCLPQQNIHAPISGTVTKIGKPYYDKNNSRHRNHFRYVEITVEDIRYRLFYVEPTVKKGDTVRLGDVIGQAQDLTKIYADITQHIHFEIKNKADDYIDPTPSYHLLKAAENG